MNYTSFTFLLFFAVVFWARYRLPAAWQRGMLLCANYVFYLWAGPRLGLYLAAETVIAYGAGRLVAASSGRKRRLWLAAGVVPLFTCLLILKYLGFFCSLALGLAGKDGIAGWQLVLPVGISFYTFSLTGYLFDVYKGRLEAEKSFLTFAVFASFFPSILSGPINRARELLPQLKEPAAFCPEKIRGGLARFVWGAGKKLVTADLLAAAVNGVWADPGSFSGPALALAAGLYALQIYFDFSAYSDMAIGVGRMLGFTLPENFLAPYFTTSVQEFWKTWHISLTSWFREYLYFPLGGSRKGKWKTDRNILIVFAVSGLWHGAAMTFVVWGLLNGVYQVVGRRTLPARQALCRRLGLSRESRIARLWQGLVTFGLISVSWIFFRSETLGQAATILGRIGTLAGGAGMGAVLGLWSKRQLLLVAAASALALGADGWKKAGRAMPETWRPVLYWGFVWAAAMAVLVLGAYGPGFSIQDFVYFKF